MTSMTIVNSIAVITIVLAQTTTGVARTTTAGDAMSMIVIVLTRLVLTRLVLTGLVTTIIIIVTTRTMTPEGAAASERLIACPIPNYLGCIAAFPALLLLAHSLYIYASMLCF